MDGWPGGGRSRSPAANSTASKGQRDSRTAADEAQVGRQLLMPTFSWPNVRRGSNQSSTGGAYTPASARSNPFVSVSCAGSPADQSPIGGGSGGGGGGGAQTSSIDEPQTVSSIENAIDRLNRLPPDYSDDNGRSSPQPLATDSQRATPFPGGPLTIKLARVRQEGPTCSQQDSAPGGPSRRKPDLDQVSSLSSSSSSLFGTTGRRSNLSAQSAPDRIQLKKKASQVAAQAPKNSGACQARKRSMSSFADSLRTDVEFVASRHAATNLAGGPRRSSLATGPAASCSKPSSPMRPGAGKRMLGPLKVTEETYAEMVAYKRSLVILSVTFTCTLFALASTVLKTHAPLEPMGARLTPVDGAHSAHKHELQHEDEWTQEQIAGWHRDHQLVLSDEFLQLFGTAAAHIRIRECQSSSYSQLSGYNDNNNFAHQHLRSSSLGGAIGEQRPGQTNVTTRHLASTTKGPGVIITTSPVSSHKNNSSNSHSDEPNGGPTKIVSTSSSTTTRRPTVRPKRMFAALNGCLFRRDTTSDSLGDLCCCSGMPRYVQVNVNSTTRHPSRAGRDQGPRTTKAPSKSSTTTPTTNAPENVTTSNSKVEFATTTTTTTSTREPEIRTVRKYLRPHLMCFVSAAGALFNAQKMVAPLVGEQSLKNANVEGKGKCIPCSCCHEHEPELVNNLLANVPPRPSKLVADAVHSPALTSRNVKLAKNPHDNPESGGMWGSLRVSLVSSMRALDDFMFHVYDVLDLALFSMRFGSYPIESVAPLPKVAPDHHVQQLRSPQLQHILHAQQVQQQQRDLNLALNAIPLRMTQHLSDDPGLEDSSIPALPTVPSTAKLLQAGPLARAKEAAPLLIDADAYDDFKPTTIAPISTSSSTTSPAPTSSRSPTKRLRRKKKKRLRQKVGSATTTTTTTTTTTVPSTRTTTTTIGESMSTTTQSIAPARTSSSPLTKTNGSLSGAATTTKSPTVIINVYAAGNGASHGGETTKTTAPAAAATTTTISATSTSTSRAPTIALLTGRQQSGQSGHIISSSKSSSTQSSDIELKIELRSGNGSTTLAPTGQLAPSSASTASPNGHRTAPTKGLQAFQPMTKAEMPSGPHNSGEILEASKEKVLFSIVGSPQDKRPEADGVKANASVASTMATFTTTTGRPALASSAPAKSAPSIVISLERDHQPTATITINTTHLGESISATVAPKLQSVKLATATTGPGKSAALDKTTDANERTNAPGHQLALHNRDGGPQALPPPPPPPLLPAALRNGAVITLPSALATSQADIAGASSPMTTTTTTTTTSIAQSNFVAANKLAAQQPEQSSAIVARSASGAAVVAAAAASSPQAPLPLAPDGMDSSSSRRSSASAETIASAGSRADGGVKRLEERTGAVQEISSAAASQQNQAPSGVGQQRAPSRGSGDQ